MNIDRRQRRRQGEDGGKGIVLGMERGHLLVGGRRRIARYVVVGLAVSGVVGALWWWTDAHRVRSDAAANAAEQKSLQKVLTLDLSHNDEQSVADDATKLINGKQEGRFMFTDKQLAEYYMEAGAAYMNLNDYQQAVVDFEVAPKFDNALKRAALEGEVSAGYAAGERQQLVPLLQQLEKLSEDNPDTLSPPASQYQEDITAIQHNQKAGL